MLGYTDAKKFRETVTVFALAAHELGQFHSRAVFFGAVCSTGKLLDPDAMQTVRADTGRYGDLETCKQMETLFSIGYQGEEEHKPEQEQETSKPVTATATPS